MKRDIVARVGGLQQVTFVFTRLTRRPSQRDAPCPPRLPRLRSLAKRGPNLPFTKVSSH